MSKSNEELAAIMLSGFLSRNDLKTNHKINGKLAAQLLKEWTEAIDNSKAPEAE